MDMSTFPALDLNRSAVSALGGGGAGYDRRVFGVPRGRAEGWVIGADWDCEVDVEREEKLGPLGWVRCWFICMPLSIDTSSSSTSSAPACGWGRD